MRHREPARDDFPARHIDHYATLTPMFTPALMHIRRAHRGDESRRAIAQREPVQMAAILRRKSRDERRLPHHPKAVRLARRREAGEEGVNEERAARSAPRVIFLILILFIFLSGTDRGGGGRGRG